MRLPLKCWKQYLYTYASLEQARIQRKIIEARVVMCDSSHNLIVDLGCMKGIIPRTEGAIGIEGNGIAGNGCGGGNHRGGMTQGGEDLAVGRSHYF